MSKDRARGRLRHGAARPAADADAVQRYWSQLPVDERQAVLCFEDVALVDRLFNIWQTLCISDMTCYVVGVRGQQLASKAIGNEFFAIEGFVSHSGEALLEAAFYAKPALVQKPDFFEIIEQQLGSPFLVGRPLLHRCEWPSLFLGSLNSWSDLVRQVFKLIEMALYEAEQSSRLKRREAVPDTCIPSKASLCSKRRAREKARKKRSALCPVCDGTRSLLDDPCPLCVEDSAGEDTPDAGVDISGSCECLGEAQSEMRGAIGDVCSQEADGAPNLYSVKGDLSTEEPAAGDYLHSDSLHSDPNFKVESCIVETSQVWRTSSWSSGWRSVSQSCNAVGWQYRLFSGTTDMRQPTSILPPKEEFSLVRAIFKNTFVHVVPDVPSNEELTRARSAPSL